MPLSSRDSTGSTASSSTGRASTGSSTSNGPSITRYSSSRRGSSNISPMTSPPTSIGPSFVESRRKHDTVDYRNYPTYDVQLVNPSEPLPTNYLVIKPVTLHIGCGPPVDNITTDRDKAAQLRSLGSSLLQIKTPLELVERMCFATFKLSKDGFRKLRRMSIYVRDESVDIDLAMELRRLLTVLAFPHLPSAKPHPRFEGINVIMNYGHIRLECPAYLDLIKFIPMLLQNMPKMQRITTSEVHKLNLKGIDNRECFLLHKPVRTDLRELANELQAGNMSSGELTGEYVLRDYHIGGDMSSLYPTSFPVPLNNLDEKTKEMSTERSRFDHNTKLPVGCPASGIFKEDYSFSKKVELPEEVTSKVKEACESEPKEKDADSDISSFITAKDDNEPWCLF